MVRKRRSNSYAYVLLVISLILVVSSFFLAFNQQKPLEVKEFDVIFMVREGRGGFDLNNTILTFGVIPPGGAGVRDILIDNNYDFSVEARIFVSDNLVNLVEAESVVVIGPGGEASIPVKLQLPTDFEEGDYSGKIWFEMYGLDE